MKINFDDKSYISLTNSKDKVVISIAAKSNDNERQIIINSVELTMEQFNELLTNLKKEN